MIGLAFPVNVCFLSSSFQMQMTTPTPVLAGIILGLCSSLLPLGHGDDYMQCPSVPTALDAVPTPSLPSESWVVTLGSPSRLDRGACSPDWGWGSL